MRQVHVDQDQDQYRPSYCRLVCTRPGHMELHGAHSLSPSGWPLSIWSDPGCSRCPIAVSRAHTRMLILLMMLVRLKWRECTSAVQAVWSATGCTRCGCAGTHDPSTSSISTSSYSNGYTTAIAYDTSLR